MFGDPSGHSVCGGGGGRSSEYIDISDKYFTAISPSTELHPLFP